MFSCRAIIAKDFARLWKLGAHLTDCVSANDIRQASATGSMTAEIRHK
jgi:hypothetical protein